MTPTISIIMATYNRAHFIVESLASIQAQTFTHFECLIIDDGSTDATASVLQPILEKDPRFLYHHRPNSYQKGLPGCRNYGLDIAKGKYLIFFDDDDIVHPQNLETGLQQLALHPVHFCHYQKQSFENDAVPSFSQTTVLHTQTLSAKDCYQIATENIQLASCTVLWHQQCFENIRFNEQLLYAEEWECYQRIIANGFSGIRINTVLYYNRKHPASNTGEFYTNNPIRRESKAQAIALVVATLQQQQLLSPALLWYFVHQAYDFRAYNLFYKILKSVHLSCIAQLKWQLVYALIPLKKPFYLFRKKYFTS